MSMGSFSQNVEAFAKKTGLTMTTICQKVAMEAFKRVIEKSPVDTGRFRANWGVQVNSPHAGDTENLDPTPTGPGTGGPTVFKSAEAVSKWNGVGSIFLCNNVIYSVPLEYGHSKIQAPAGMIRVTVSEMQGGITKQIIEGAI